MKKIIKKFKEVEAIEFNFEDLINKPNFDKADFSLAVMKSKNGYKMVSLENEISHLLFRLNNKWIALKLKNVTLEKAVIKLGRW